MKTNSSIITAEFRMKLKGLLRDHPTNLIKFSEFIELLRINQIRFYSRDDILRLNKIFQSSSKLAQLDYAINFLQLFCVQYNENMKYFVVKTSGRPSKHSISEVKLDHNHSTNECFHFFRKIMKTKYGNQINWFKVLGGVTISIKIEKEVARVTLNKILKNTSHSDCSDRLIKLFSRSEQKYIEWKYFMDLLKRRGEQRVSMERSPSKIQNIPTITRALSQKVQLTDPSIKIQDQFSIQPKRTRRRTLTFQVTPKACQLYDREEGIFLKTRYSSVKSAHQNRVCKKKGIFSSTAKNFRCYTGSDEEISSDSNPLHLHD